MTKCCYAWRGINGLGALIGVIFASTNVFAAALIVVAGFNIACKLLCKKNCGEKKCDKGACPTTKA